MAANISSLRELDLDNNDLTTIPIATHSLKELTVLHLAQNPITSLSNTSLLGIAEHLSELDIANFDLDLFENGALSNMNSLRVLRMSTYDKIRTFNIPKLLENNFALRSLEVHVNKKSTPLAVEMQGDLPPKLGKITFSGRGLKNVDKTVLKGIRYPSLHVCFKNTSVSTVSADIFRNMDIARDVTIEIIDNLELSHIENPSNGRKPGLPGKSFLVGMEVSGNRLSCDCSLG